MATEQSTTENSSETWGSRRRGRRGGTAGALVLAAAIGVGVGLLAAPQAGTKTRKVLRKRLSALGEDLGEGYDEVQELSGKAGRRIREGAGRVKEGAERLRERAERLRARRQAALEEAEDDLDEDEEEEDELDEDEGSGRLGTILALAAGLAATLLITSDRAAPARERIREAADAVRERAGEQWDRYQRGSRSNGAPTAADAASSSTGGAPQAS
ncbi:MAG: YtxH domain-containing protein [Gemmatimonadales bacterium]